MQTVKLFFGLLILVLLSINSNAQVANSTGVKTQENTLFSTSNSIELEGSSDVRKIEIEVNEEASNFDLDVRGEIRIGSIKIEIFDPKGKKRGSFSTGAIVDNKTVKPAKDSKASKYKEQVNGHIMQRHPTPGTWIIKIIPQNAHGKLNFRSHQYSTK